MKLSNFLSAALTLLTVGGAVSALGQNTVIEQTRIGGSTQENNPDFGSLPGFASGTTSDHTTAPGVVSGWSTASRYSAASIPGGPGTNVTLSPNGGNATIYGTTNSAGTSALAVGTTYLVSVAFAGTPTASSSDIVVYCSDTGMSGADTFNGILSGCFQGGNGYNKWIPVGLITPNTANPTINFAYNSGVNGRWNVDAVMFSPITATPPTGTYQYWTPGAPGAGGSGSWTASTTYWNTLANGTGTQGTYTQADLADFTNGSGTVSIDPVNGITTDGGLEFDVSGYILAGGTLTLGSFSSTSGTNIAVAPGSVTINAPISAPYGLCSAYLGSINLGAAVSFPGAVGTVTINTGTVHLNPGVNQSFPSLAGTPVTGLPFGVLSLGNSTCTVGSDNTSTTFAGIIVDGGASSPGALVKTGTGTLTLTGANTYSGPTTINQGVIHVATTGDPFGTPPASVTANQLTLNGGRVDFTAVATLVANRGITLGAGGGVLSTPGTGTTPTISGPISGSGSLTIPSGGFDLKASNSFSGGIYVTATPVDSGGNNLCSVRFDAQGASGTGKIFMSPTTGFNCTLRNFNTATNIIVPNAIELDLWTNTQASAQIYLAGGASGTNLYPITFSGNINGAASVNIGLDTAGGSSNPGGTVNLSGSNSLWTGGATLQAGTLGVGSSNALGTGGLFLVPQGPAGVLLATTPLTGSSALTNSIGLNTAVSSLTIGGSNNLQLAGPVFLYASSTITVSNTGSTILSGGINDAVPFSGDSLTIAGSGTLTLRGVSTYDGGTFVSSGTLDANTSNSLPGNVTVNGGVLQLDSPSAMVATGTLAVNSPGVVNLNFTGSQTNAALSINGTLQPYGVYGASTNNPSGVFTGTGNLVVSPNFVITSEAFDNTGTNFVVCWQSTIGYTYDVLTNGAVNVAVTNWATINPSPITATNTTTCYTLPVGIPTNKIFVVIRADNVSP